MTESIKSYLDNGEFAAGIFIDLEKAFDTVNHEIKCNKLTYYGFRPLAFESSFVVNHTHFAWIKAQCVFFSVHSLINCYFSTLYN